MITSVSDNRDVIADAIKYYFQGPKLDDCIASGVFKYFVDFALFLLPSHRPRFTAALAGLENSLIEEYKGRIIKEEPLYRDLLSQNDIFKMAKSNLEEHINFNRPEKYRDYASGLLSGYLARTELSWGYKNFIDDHGHPRSIWITPLDAESFRLHISEGRPFKDPTILGNHGEFTHRLQWYLAAKAGIFNDGQECRVVEVYKQLASIVLSENIDEGKKGEGKRYGLWDFLCDADENEKSRSWLKPLSDLDFRCPANLNNWLTTKADTKKAFPLLSTFLAGRQRKRNMTKLNPELGIPLEKDYMSKKIYGTAYIHLTNSRKAAINEICEKNAWIDNKDIRFGSNIKNLDELRKI